MSKTIPQLKTMWNKESESYKTQEIGTGTHRFVRELLECPEVFNLKEGILSADVETRKMEFVDESKTKGKRHADFRVYINSEIQIPVEVELYTHIQDGEGQLATYQADLDKKYGILTDGHTWRFYNNSLYKAFNLDHLLSDTEYFLDFWKEYIKPEYYYLSFFEQTGQLSLLGNVKLDVENNRELFFQDITTLIRVLRNKLRLEGYFNGMGKKEAEKKATEITYAYIIQFILYKTLVDNDFENFSGDYASRIDSIHQDIKNRSYKGILGTIDGISEQISANIYRPFAKEQEYIRTRLIALLHKPKNELSDIAPWLDIFVFIKKYYFENVRNEIFGYVYENYLKELYEEEKKGQYFTDPAVVDFILEQVGYTSDKIRAEVKSGQLDKLSLVDPACGSGTFLYSATREIVKSFPNMTKETSQQAEDILTNNIFGLDIEEFPLYLAEMSILMRMLTLIMGQKYNNPLDKKIKVFLTRDSLTEFMGSGLETAGGGASESGGQSSYFGKLVEPQYSSYVRDEQDLMEMKQSMASFPRRRFDYVVANPPYVSYNESSKQHIPVFEQLKKGKVKLNNIYGVNLHSTPGNPKRYRPNPNLYAFFVALGLALLKDNAKLCYIIPQTFLVNADFDVLRYHLSKSVTLEKILTFSGKMFLGRGLKQNKPIPTSSLIFVASRRPPIPDHVVEIVNYQGKDEQIQDTFANISKGINTVTKTIPQETLLDNISNWNFIKLNPRQLGFYEIYNHNSEDFSSYFQHSIARTRFSDTFIFDGGYSIDERKFLSSPRTNELNYERPRLNGKYWTVKENLGYWPNQRTKGEPMFIDLRQGNQGYSFLDSKYKIIWSYNATDRFFYTDRPVIWARNTMLGISSNNRQEILYLFALLNSKVTRFILDNFVKIEQEDTRTILVSLQIVKNQLKVPKITDVNRVTKKIIIEQVEELLKCDSMRLSDIVDFSSVLLQQFDNIRVDGTDLVLVHNDQEKCLSIKGDSNLVSRTVLDWLGPKIGFQSGKIRLAELRDLPIIDSHSQSKIKNYIDDLVFALYFGIAIDDSRLTDRNYIHEVCSNIESYQLLPK